MRFYDEEAEAVLRDVDGTSEGLTSVEAEKRLAAYGKNKLAEGKKDSLIKRFFQQIDVYKRQPGTPIFGILKRTL